VEMDKERIILSDPGNIARETIPPTMAQMAATQLRLAKAVDPEGGMVRGR